MNLVASHWSANPWVLAGCALAAAVYLAGLGGLAGDARRAGGRLPPSRAGQTAVFAGGLLVVALALVSPLGYWAQRFVWVRSVQDLLLAEIGPALLVLGVPWPVLWRGFRPARPGPGTGDAGLAREDAVAAGPRLAGRGGPRLAQAGAPAGPAGGERLSWRSPAVWVTLAFNLAWCGWHLAVPYDAARSQPVVFALEVLSYLGLGVLFWLQVIGSGPAASRLPARLRALLVTGTALAGTMLAIVLVFGSQPVYLSYRPGHRNLSLVADQQVGGAVLWVVTLVPYSIAAFVLLAAWLRAEEAEGGPAGLDRLLGPPGRARAAWPSRTGLR
jgi:putative membrane protein